MERFSNSVLLPDNLPLIEKEPFHPIDKKQLIILYVRIAALFLVLAAGMVALLYLPEVKLPTYVIVLMGLSIVLIAGCFLLVTILGFHKKGYLVRENDISYQKGLIRFKQVSVPFNRIQHVEVNQGILEKYLKLATIKLYTAGGSASDLSIPGLPVEIAQSLKDFLSGKISEHE